MSGDDKKSVAHPFTWDLTADLEVIEPLAKVPSEWTYLTVHATFRGTEIKWILTNRVDIDAFVEDHNAVVRAKGFIVCGPIDVVNHDSTAITRIGHYLYARYPCGKGFPFRWKGEVHTLDRRVMILFDREAIVPPIHIHILGPLPPIIK